MPEALVQCAILGSPGRCLTEEGILEALQSKYPYYRLTHEAEQLQVSHSAHFVCPRLMIYAIDLRESGLDADAVLHARTADCVCR